jgi:hypothetical protein
MLASTFHYLQGPRRKWPALDDSPTAFGRWQDFEISVIAGASNSDPPHGLALAAHAKQAEHEARGRKGKAEEDEEGHGFTFVAFLNSIWHWCAMLAPRRADSPYSLGTGN